MSRNPASSLVCGAAGRQEPAHWAPVFDATMISPGQTVCGTIRPSTCNLIWSTDWGGRQAGPTSGREGVVSLGRDQVSLDATQNTQDTLPLDGAPRRRAVGAADVVGRQCAADVVAVFRVLAVFRVEIPARRQDADVAYGPGPAGRVNSPPAALRRWPHGESGSVGCGATSCPGRRAFHAAVIARVTRGRRRGRRQCAVGDDLARVGADVVLRVVAAVVRVVHVAAASVIGETELACGRRESL